MEQKEILKEIKNTLEAIKLYDGAKIYNILNDEINETIEIYKNSSIDYIYISHDKNYCIRCVAPLEYYYSLINKLNLNNNCIESGLNYEANSIRFSVVWCEHDLIIAFKPVIIDLEYEKRFYTIQNGAISKGWILWNVKPIIYNNKYYVLVIKKNEVIDYKINIKNVSAYEITKDEYKITLDHHIATGSPAELKRYLKGKDPFYKKHALLFKPVIEKLYNIKIDEV